MMFLDELEPGAQAVISSFDTDKLPLKLIEMGCLPGNKIALVHRAPFNDPLYIKIDESHLAIRQEIASQIEINLL